MYTTYLNGAEFYVLNDVFVVRSGQEPENYLSYAEASCWGANCAMAMDCVHSARADWNGGKKKKKKELQGLVMPASWSHLG